MKNRIIYRLTEEDVQTVASDIINRKLNKREINSIEEIIADNIKWYDAIESAITNVIVHHLESNVST